MSVELVHPFPGVLRPEGISLGGNQRWLDSTVLQRCGCGVVAALDLVRYLHLWHGGCRTELFTGVMEETALPMPVYNLCIQRMCRRYVPVIYPVGTAGVALALGLDAYFRRFALPLRAWWGVPQAQLWLKIEEQLAEDLPVILAIGNRFPTFWEKKGAALCRKGRDGALRESVRTKAHFVTVLGMDEEWLRICTWGREYYLSKAEFRRYCDTASLSVLCNIVWLSKRK